jgi:hypothetical protein
MLDLLSSGFLDIHLAAASSNIANSAQAGSDFATNMAKDFWSNIFQMGLFGRVAQAAMAIAAVGTIYKASILVKELNSNALEPTKLVSSLLSIVFVLVMLWYSGANSMSAVMATRNYSNGISDQVMVGIASDFQSLSATRNLEQDLKTEPIFTEFKSAINGCANKLKTKCFLNAVADLKQKLNAEGVTDPKIIAKVNQIEVDAQAEYDKHNAPDTATTADPPEEKNIFQRTADTLSLISNPGNAVQHIIEILLTGLAIAFFFSVEIAMLLFGLTFPINLALSLFDPAPLKSWFGNFWTLVNAKLCFSIITGIVVYLQLWMETRGGNIGLFVIELMLAIFAPVATFFYCQGSALALAGAMNSMASAPVKGAVGAATGGASKFLGGAAKGAGITPGQAGSRLGRRMRKAKAAK